MSLAKTNIVLGAVCAVMFVPTVLLLLGDAETFVDVSRIPRMFDGFTADNVGAIMLAEPREQQAEIPAAPDQAPRVTYDQLNLQLTEDGWRIGQVPNQVTDLAGARVLADRVESSLFQHLREIPNDPDTLVQKDATPEQLAEYGLDEAHAFWVRCVDRTGQVVVADLMVGMDANQWRKGTDGVNGVFVRARGSTDVVLYELEKPWRRSLEPTEWLDRTLFRLDPDKVRRLTLRNSVTGRKTFVFERAPNQARWQATGGNDDLGALRQAEIEGLVQRLRYVSAQAYERPLSRAGDMQALGLYPPIIELTMTVQDGNETRAIDLQVGNRVPGRNEYYLTCSESPEFLMTWSSSTAAQFDLDVAHRLFDPKPN